MAAFNYAPIRATAIALVKQFGNNTVQAKLLRNVNSTPADATKPWRGDDPTVKEFKFTGIDFTLGFPALSEPVTDGDKDLIAPGDLATTAAEGDPSTLCGDPTTTDRIELPSGVYAILGLQDVSGAGVPIIYKMRLRAWPRLSTQPSTPF